jgi:hypothetical protein
MREHRTRNLIRVFIGVALCAALAGGALVTVPEDLPAVALRQTGIYRLQVALLAFYGALLLITPAFFGVIRGRLPIEISTRGAKFAEEVNQSGEATEAAVKELELSVGVAEELKEAVTELDRMRSEVTVRARD